MFPVLGRAASPRHRRVKFRRDRMEIPLLSLRLACVGLLSALGWVHLHLWQIGYRHIPTIGPLLLVAAMGSVIIAVALLVWPSRFVALLGFATVGGILAGLIVSINVGRFGLLNRRVIDRAITTDNEAFGLGDRDATGSAVDEHPSNDSPKFRRTAVLRHCLIRRRHGHPGRVRSQPERCSVTGVRRESQPSRQLPVQTSRTRFDPRIDSRNQRVTRFRARPGEDSWPP
jgi:hypothetical protein